MTTHESNRKIDPFDFGLLLLWLLVILLALLLTSCAKTEHDCGCGYIDSVIETDDRYYYTFPDECSGRVYTMWWFKTISDPPQVGDRWCVLNEITI